MWSFFVGVFIICVSHYPLKKTYSDGGSVHFRYTSLLVQAVNDAPYGMIDKVLTDCEFEGINVGSELADSFNAMDEATEFDIRVHSDYIIEHTGFAGYVRVCKYLINRLLNEC